jgi:hypothetical protein
MRTDTHRLAGTLVALGFLAGWFSASWVSPPTAVTQVRPARSVAPPPDVPMPRVALDVVTAPDTSPASARNPFVFTDRPAVARAAVARGDAGMPAFAPVDEAAPADPAPPVAADPPPPSWRVVGLAADAEGRLTAVVTGAGDVFLLGLGDRLPDGSSVVEIDGTGLVLSTPAGERMTLRFP